jgi:hypothetical protein
MTFNKHLLIFSCKQIIVIFLPTNFKIDILNMKKYYFLICFFFPFCFFAQVGINTTNPTAEL